MLALKQTEKKSQLKTDKVVEIACRWVYMQMTCEPIISDVSTYQNGVLLISHNRGEVVVSKSVGPACGRLDVRIPAASDLRL